jgi:GTP-binding protein LepA
MQEQFLDQMELERERGITIKLQPVRMNYTLHTTHYTLNLIDTPGHVDFTYEVSRSLAAVEGAILLVDATKGVQAQTLANLHLAQKQGLVIIPVINKIDLANSKIKEAEEEIQNLLPETIDSGIFRISAKNGEGVEKVLEEVINKIPPPTTNYKLQTTNCFRALIFDSAFDAYKGVVAYVRVFSAGGGSASGGDGLAVGDKIKFFATGVNADAIEVGYFSPKLKKCDKLSAGDIGYIATGLKDPGKVRVGDTIFKTASGEFAEPLPGYREPEPVVFASFYPDNSEEYDLLKDALGKLKLTDASLIYEPESSPGLGRGFRVGFLGMLHVEIISERLRREFGLNLIISTPSVEYHVALKNGKNLNIRSAVSLPDPTFIEKIEEPIVDLEILSPSEYMGQIMKLMSELRSQYKSTDYLTKEITILKYQVPLSEIITDFYDKLKSVTSGYASMNYEPAGHQKSDLIRLDILVAEELIGPFSKIVPRASAYYEGKKIVEKLKKVIPKQWFAVSLQAAIGGKIIARETISALRKDVTGYLYGGDVTRKKKLLEKQKKGKKKMKELGKVNIPQKVFLEMLKR